MRIILLSLVVLTACVPEKETEAAEEAAQEQLCQPDALNELVGQSDEVLERMKLKEPVRIIRPDTAVTMDHVPHRLNITVDENGIITRIYCG